MLLEITLPFPPSMNHGYRSERGVTHLSKEARKYKKTVEEALKKVSYQIPPQTELAAIYDFYCSSKQLHIRDWDGLVKFLQDQIFKSNLPQPANDAWVMQALVNKIPVKKDTEPYCKIVITAREVLGCEE